MRFGSPVALTTTPLRDAEIPHSEKKVTRAIASVSLPVLKVLVFIRLSILSYTTYIANSVPKCLTNIYTGQVQESFTKSTKNSWI